MKLTIDLSSYQSDQNICCSLTDEQGTIVYVNDKFCELTGYSNEELIGQNHRILSSGYHQADFYRNLWDTILAGHIWQGDICDKSKDGKLFWVNTIISPMKDMDSGQHLFLAIQTSIDDRIHAEETNKYRLQQLDNLLFKVSHDLRQPITQLIGLSELLNAEGIDENEFRYLVFNILNSSKLLDTLSKEITKHLETIMVKKNLSFAITETQAH